MAIGLLIATGLPGFNTLQSAHAAGATLAVSPGSVTTQPGKTFTVAVEVVAGEPINSASGVVNYNTSVLQATAVSLSGSAFTLWTDTPAAGSKITFGGGLPTPGLVGTGKLFTITFKALAAGSASISFSGGKILANDGQGTNVYTGASSGNVTVSQVLVDLMVSSSTHPSQNKWYTVTTANLSWNQPSDITGYTYSLSGPTTKTGTGNNGTVSFPGLTEGRWSFQLTGHSAKGDRTASFGLQIDTTPPAAFTVTTKQISDTDPYPIASFAATDSLSGIDHYEVTAGDQTAKNTVEASLKLDRQLPGTRKITVKAVDKAGNATSASADFSIKGFPGPKITDYDKFVSVLQPVSLTGTALFGATVRLFVDGKPAVEFPVKENLSNHQRQLADASKYQDGDVVEWNYFYKGTLLPGLHPVSAIQIKPDTSESESSNTVTPRVLWSSLTLGSLTVPLALVAIVLVGLLIGLLGLLLWVWKHSRRFVGHWQDRLTKVRQKVDHDLSALEKDVHRTADQLEDQPKNLRNKVESQIEGTTKNVDKTFDEIIKTAENEEKKL